jgi:hypothetical protein
MKNRSILIKCQILCRLKNIDLKLIKVKGHSNDEWNDKADMIAKEEAIRNDFQFNHDQKEAGPLLYYPRIKGEGVENNIRREIKNLNSLTNQYEWSYINEIRRKIESDVDWDVTWELFRRMKGRFCRSMGISAKWNWCFKSFHNLLPTTKWLKIRKPILYKDAKCPLCHLEEEDTKHFVDCVKLQDKWALMQDSMAQEIEQTLEKFAVQKKLTINRLQEDDLKHHIIEMLFENNWPKSHASQWISCSIDTRFDNILKQHIHNRETRIDLLTNFLEIFIKLFRKNIWNFRCEKFVEWEKDNKISQKNKREKCLNSHSRINNRHQNLNPQCYNENYQQGEDISQIEIRKNRTRDFYKRDERLKLAITKVDFWYPEIIKRNYKEEWIFIKKRRIKEGMDEEAQNTTIRKQTPT